MRTAAFAVLGLVVGFVAGIAISEIVGIVGVVLGEGAVGVKYLSLYLAGLFAVTLPIVDGRSRPGTPGPGSDR